MGRDDTLNISREELEKMPDEELESLYEKALKEVPPNMTLISDIGDILEERKEKEKGLDNLANGNGDEKGYADYANEGGKEVNGAGVHDLEQTDDSTTQENEEMAEQERINCAEEDIAKANQSAQENNNVQENSVNNHTADINQDDKKTVEEWANKTGVLLANCQGGPFTMEEFNDELAKAENIKVIVEPGKAEGYLNGKGWEYAHNDLDTVLRFTNEDTVIAEHINDKSYLLLDNEEKVYDSQGKGEDGRNKIDGEDIRGKVEEDKDTTFEETIEKYQRGEISESEALRYLKTNDKMMAVIDGGVAATAIAAETLTEIGAINANMPGIGLAEMAEQLATNPLAESIESGEMPVVTNEFHSVENMAKYDSEHPETDEEQKMRKEIDDDDEIKIRPINGGGN